MPTKEQEKVVPVFNRLNRIDCSEYTEKKNNLTYLSWAWAWGKLKENYPKSFYTIYENDQGWNYFHDGKTCWVKTGVTVVEEDGSSLEHIEYLPIMDFKNQSISKDKVTSYDVNKAIQRSLTKAVARHGLGLYIYAGEDLPEEGEEEKQAKAEAAAKAEAERMDVISAINSEMTAKASTMTAEQKRAFADTVIIPTIGQANYKICKDVVKLKALLKKIKAA